MILEALVSTACIFGNVNACSNSTQAYSKYTGIDKKIEEIGKRYLVLSVSVATINAVKDGKVVFPVLVSQQGHVLTSEVGSGLIYLRYNFGY